MSAMIRKPKDLPRWRVIRIVGNAAREVCTMPAASADAAIRRAIREYAIDDPHQQARLGDSPVRVRPLLRNADVLEQFCDRASRMQRWRSPLWRG